MKIPSLFKGEPEADDKTMTFISDDTVLCSRIDFQLIPASSAIDLF
jgi:hypothetical protein